MTKDVLTLDNVKRDLRHVIWHQDSVQSDWRFVFIAPALLCPVFLYFWLNTFIFALIGVPLALYHIVRYTAELKALNAKWDALLKAADRGDVYVSLETLSHISSESSYNTGVLGSDNGTLNEAKFYYFESGRCWQDPMIRGRGVYFPHYEWSREFKLSPNGLYNTSVKGNEFYMINLQSSYDIAYIYPTKFFELSEELKGKKE